MLANPKPPPAMLIRSLSAGAFALVVATDLTAQSSLPEADAIRKLQWRSIGPANNAGRVSAIVGVPGDPATYYVAGAAGGIFKTTNGGTTFRPIFDAQNVLSVGAIAIAPSDPNVLYVGSGEGNPRNSTSF